MKKSILLSFLLSMAASGFATEAQIGGLWYDLISKTKGATVLQYKDNVKYKGDIVIPETVTQNGVTYPVTSIAAEAFLGCTEMTSVTIPANMKFVGDGAFYGCNKLKTKGVHISDLSAWCKIEYEAIHYTTGAQPLYCGHSLYLNGTLLTDLVIPDDVTSIGRLAFHSCTSITSITAHSNLTNVTLGAFGACSKVTSIYISDLKLWCQAPIPVNQAHSLYLNGEKITNLEIPSGVKSLAPCAFYYCTDLTSVTFPSSLTSIGREAFSGCSGLTSVTIPDKITTIEPYTFAYCKGLTSVTIPNSVTSIGGNAFNGCRGLASITIPNSVTSIGNSAFAYCSGLTSITVPQSVKELDSYAFGSCSGLTSVNIPNSLDSLKEGTFYSCYGLTSVTIPDGVKVIDKRAFYECKNLTTVSMGKDIAAINDYAFYNCPELADVYCQAVKVPAANDLTFKDSRIDYATLHVPTVAVDSYKATAPWSGFKYIYGKCAKPAITLNNGKLTFSSEDEGVEYHYEISDADIKTGGDTEVSLTFLYTISLYTSKAGLDNSDVVTMQIQLSPGAGGGKKGDVNADGIVDVADIANVIDIMAGKQ